MRPRKTVLLIGGSGLLGRALSTILSGQGYPLTVKSGKAELDITNLEAVKKAVEGFDFVINCAAYTAVDLAESNAADALKLNSLGPRNLSLAIKETEGRLVHFSTDYRYGGCVERAPLDESVAASPVGVYGYSKFLGDEFVQLILPERSAILVTSWLHGETGNSFVGTINRLTLERSELTVVSDQIGSPTYAGWLAAATSKFLSVFQPGLYHAANQGEISWFDFAVKIAELNGSKCKILPQSTAELNRPAPRPPYSALNCKKLESLLGVPCQSWQDGLKSHMSKILEKT